MEEEFDFTKPTTKLTKKERIFCHEYIVDWNGARAARVAGYSEDSIYSIASENLTKPKLKAYIKHIQRDLAKEAGLSKLRVTKELMNLAFSSMASFKDDWMTDTEFDQLTPEQKACISQIEYTKISTDSGDRNMVKFKLHDKVKSIEILNKMYGYNEPEKIDYTDKTPMTNEERAARLEVIMNEAKKRLK